MQEPGAKTQRFDITYFDGVNAAVQRMLAKRQEFTHVENARSGSIGSIEKRQGQAKYGTAAGGWTFLASDNYGLTKFLNDGANVGMYRITAAAEPDSSISVTAYENVKVVDTYNPNGLTLYIKAVEDITITEPTIFSRVDANAIILDGTSEAASIWSLDNYGVWNALSDTEANNIIGAQFDSAPMNGNLMMVNQRDYNRYIKPDGTTVIDSTQAGHFYNSPRASRAAVYKNRIYLADFMRAGVRYKNMVTRSSYPLGIVALVNGDYDSGGADWVIPVTDTKYFYADSGMNVYEIYRGPSKVATITISSVQGTSITATNANVTFQAGFSSFLTADEIWVSGTFNGEKQWRWMNNSTSIGQDVKQYDTFRLSGGDEDEITLMRPVGNVLMISNKNTFMTWNDYTLQEFDQGVGCVSKNGHVKLLGSLYFLHYSGVYSTNGSTPTLLSRKVDRYIRGATRAGLENAVAGYKGLSTFFCIGDVTLYKNDGSFWKILRDVCLEYNIADQTWFIHTNVPAKQMATLLTSDGAEHLLFSHKTGSKSIKEFLIGASDDGENIFFRVDLPPIQLMKEQEVYANPIAISTESERGALMRCFVSTDGDDFYELQGALEKGVSTIKITARDPESEDPIICHWIQVSFRESSPQLCRLIQASIMYLPSTITVPR